ncbi:MAG: serine hydrolase [Candidatus Eisenbacteria bacterium]|nr:serine hydrolase [Candidatus Eisenbacteria bacterium]
MPSERSTPTPRCPVRCPSHRPSRCGLLLLALLLLAPGAPLAAPSPAGHWEGEIEIPGMALEVLIDLALEEGVWSGSISIPAQNAQDLPLERIAVAGDSVSFAIAGIPGGPTFAGALDEEGATIAGTFTQGGQSFPFHLASREDPAARARAALSGLEETVTGAIEEWQTPGLAIGVVVGDEVVLAEGYGYRDREEELPVTPQTLFAVGSCTKAFTCFALATLVDEGRLDWDDPLIEHLPAFRMQDEYVTAHLTPRDMVSHRSGLPRHDLVWYGKRDITRTELVRRLRHLELSRELREQFQYNNLMYLTAGYLTEQLTGLSWERAVRERIFDPLEMARSNFSVAESQRDADHALPYLEEEDEIRQIDFRPIDVMGPAGSINSCVEEMNRWMMVHLNGGQYGETELLSAPAVNELHAPQTIIPATPDSPEESQLLYAMGWMVRSWRGHHQVQHGGNIDGFSALVTLFPNDEVGIVALSNRNADPLPDAITKVIADRVLELEPEDWLAKGFEKQEEAEAFVEKAKEKKDLFRQKGTRPSRPREAFAGRFEHPGYGVIEIVEEGSQLVMILNQMRMPLDHWHYDVFVVAESDEEVIPEDLRAVFLGDAAGHLDRLRIALEPTVDPIVFERLPAARMYEASHLERLTGDYELPGQVIEIILQGNTLTARVGGQPALELTPRGHDEFGIAEMGESVRVRFTLPESGPATEILLIQQGGVFTAPRVTEEDRDSETGADE